MKAKFKCQSLNSRMKCPEWIKYFLIEITEPTAAKELSQRWELENKTLWQRFHCKARQFVNRKVRIWSFLSWRTSLKELGHFLLVQFMNNPYQDPLTDLEDEMLYNCESYCGQPCNVTRISTIYYEVNDI